MEIEVKRLSVRSVSVESVDKLQELNRQFRLPMALLIEDSIDLLWETYFDGVGESEYDNSDNLQP